MRKKIKDILNKEEGFTLVELLAVIVILGIILAIAIPGIGRVIENAQDNSDEAEQELIADAGRMYYLSETEESTYVSVKKLIETGYLENNVSDVNKTGYVHKVEKDKQVMYQFSKTTTLPAASPEDGA